MKKSAIALGVVLAMISGSAMAHKEGDTIIKGGFAHYDANMEFDTNTYQDTRELSKGLDNTSNGLFISLTHMTSDKIGIELAYHHGMKVKGDYDFVLERANSYYPNYIERHGYTGEFGSKNVPITLTANYYFGDANTKFRPYVGAGLSYIKFDVTKNKSSFGYKDDLINGSIMMDEYLVNNDIDPAVGIAAKIGADYYVTDNVMITASVTYISAETTMTYTNKYHNGIRDTESYISKDISINPVIATVGIGYRF
nr:MAG TPA: outer membrane protein [Caudoviricetes sp.]